MLDVPGHGRSRSPRGAYSESLQHFSVILHGGGGPAVNRRVKPGRDVAQRYPEQPGELRRATEEVHCPVKPEVELLELVVVSALGGCLEIRVQPFKGGNRFGITVPDSPGSEFPGEEALAGKDVTDVIAGQRDDDVATAGLEPYQALRAQFQECFAYRGGADVQVLRDRLGADEISAVQFAGDDQVAYVRSSLGAQLRAMATVLPRPVRRLLGRLSEGFSVPGNGLSTTLWRTCRSSGRKPQSKIKVSARKVLLCQVRTSAPPMRGTARRTRALCRCGA